MSVSLTARTPRPLVMGILNVTPDSFSDGGKFLTLRKALTQAQSMVEAGADVIDVGGESTRPGASAVSLDEELRRVIPVVRELSRRFSVDISVDTSKAEVARQAIEAGASMINDVTAFADPRMLQTLVNSRASVILMHMRGTPRTMQKKPRYKDVFKEVAAYLAARARKACDRGLDSKRIWIDPGLGFGKTVEHNLTLLRRLKPLTQLGFPVLIGPSRKSFIGKVLAIPEAQERLAGTLACVALAFQAGVSMVRVHDVKPAVELLRMLKAVGKVKCV